MRVGIHTGDVIHRSDDFIGFTVSKAARVAAAANGGQILLSATTVGVINDSAYEFDPPIAVELKGIEGSHTLLPLVQKNRP
jgi:adenylate cyclase